MFNVQSTTSIAASRCASPPPPRENEQIVHGFPHTITSIRQVPSSEELTIFSRACQNPYLGDMINSFPEVGNQVKRFSALGMGITAIANRRDTNSGRGDVTAWCNDVLDCISRNSEYKDRIFEDPAMKERGAEFVRFISYGKNDGFVDTLYAQGITIGKDVQRGPVDDLMVKHANAFLDLIKASGEKP